MNRSVKAKLISAPLVEAAALQAEHLMDVTPGLREAWLDQVRTSTASTRCGGTLQFMMDHDWVPAFFVWYHGGGASLPREKAGA